MAGRLRKPPVMGGFFQRRENEVEIDNKINLGFSGGGFRATFYCLGAYRRLVELGLEKHVNEITSVSGGSITAAITALNSGRIPKINYKTLKHRTFCTVFFYYAVVHR